MLEGFDADRSRLSDLERLSAVLEALPARLGLTQVGTPQLFDGGPSRQVLAGTVLLAESHFSLHLQPELGALHADLFSCRPFDPEPARAFLEELYDFARCTQRLVERGAAR